jgi:hypothetical protein
METKYFLYIKTSPLGLKYLGKTTKDPHLYSGSGKIWKRHIKKHNLQSCDIKTEIVLETTDIQKLIEMGIQLSKLYNIVESKEWANLIEEGGDGGDTSKFIDYSDARRHDPSRSKHLNLWLETATEEERKKVLRERISKVDFKDRSKKAKQNTDWDSWRESIKNRKTDYSFLDKIHERNKKPIYQLNLVGDIICEFKSAIDAANELNINVGTIRHCLTGRNKTAFGYKWKYKNIQNESK